MKNDMIKLTLDEREDLPGLLQLSDAAASPPALPKELIEGVLRRGHKMLISGSSKAGKSFLLMELCIAIAEGKPWLSFPCRKGRVLYVNLEIDPASCVDRFIRIYDALGYTQRHMEDILIWNLRGHAVPLDMLVPELVRRTAGRNLDAVIIDPIYKVITGDENSATDMGYFCNQFDRICTSGGCAVIYSHHHSKGFQGTKRAMDRASGSGVFARDPDAQLDMIELELTENVRSMIAETGATAWRMESNLREFKNFKPVDFWFEYPIHRVDKEALHGLQAQGAPRTSGTGSRNARSAQASVQDFRNAFAAQAVDGSVSVKDMTEYLGVTDKTVYYRLRKMKNEFDLVKGRIYRIDGAMAISA